MELPQVEMAGVEQLERFLEHADGTVAGALLGLAGEERFGAAPLHDLADIAFAPALRTAVDRRSIDVIDAQIESAFHDRDGDVLVVSALESGLAAQAEDAGPVTSPAEVASRHGAGGHGVVRIGGGAGARGTIILKTAARLMRPPSKERTAPRARHRLRRRQARRVSESRVCDGPCCG